MCVIYKLLKIVAIFLISILAFNLWADEGEYKNTPPSFFFQYAYGKDDVDNLTLALGLRQSGIQGGFSGLYVSQSFFEKEGKVTGIGILAFNMTPKNDMDYGANVHLGISKTDISDYERTGLEMGGNIYFFITNVLSLYIGTTLRPTFLSLDWGDNELMEINYITGIGYQPISDMTIFAQYSYDGFVSEEFRSSTIGDGFQVGFSWLY